MNDFSPLDRKPPTHVAIIMDGNGRWAKARGLPRIAGHRAGAEAVRRTLTASVELGIKYLTLFGFSSENWKRPATEVSDLMSLLRHYIRGEIAELHRNGVRAEIALAARRLAEDAVAGRVAPAAIDEDAFAARLLTADIPDPDLLIRTSGEQRISNFLLWQTAYAELVFTPTLWPDFAKSDLEKALRDYQGRDRRYGASVGSR